VHDGILAGLDLMSALLAEKAAPKALAEYGKRVDALVAGVPEAPVAAEAPETAEIPEEAAAPAKAAHEGWISVDLAKMDALTNLLGDLVQDQSRRERAQEAVVEVVSSWREAIHTATAALEMLETSGESAEREVFREILDRQVALERELRTVLARSREDIFDEGLRVGEAESRLREIRMMPISSLFGGYLRAARDLGRDLGKPVRVQVQGDSVGADKRVLDQIAEPLLHLVRNAVDHGLEPPAGRKAAGKAAQGLLSLKASQAGGRLKVTVSDDGGGLDAEAIGRAAVSRGLLTEAERSQAAREQLLEYVFREGFSTKTEVSDVSGRGVGLDVVRRRIEGLGGTVSVVSERGRGTTFLLDVPLSLALVDVLLFRDGGITYALPTSCLDRVLTLDAGQLMSAAGGTVFNIESEIVPLGDLAAIVGGEAASHDEADRVLVVAQRGRKMGIRVSQVLGYRSLVQREPDAFLEGVRLLAATAQLGEGDMALVLDPGELIAAGGATARTAPRAAVARKERSILLVDDSEITRLLLAEVFQRLGYEVREASDGARALEAVLLRRPDLILLDIDMPVMSGFQFLERFRADRAGPHVPVIMFSSRGSDEDRRRSVELGADAYLVKSRFQESDLVEAVQRFLPRESR
jgi:chemotaxis protein histidine kinase CheA/ActR/RegA family two-component response regulator